MRAPIWDGRTSKSGGARWREYRGRSSVITLWVARYLFATRGRRACCCLLHGPSVDSNTVYTETHVLLQTCNFVAALSEGRLMSLEVNSSTARTWYLHFFFFFTEGHGQIRRCYVHNTHPASLRFQHELVRSVMIMIFPQLITRE